MKKDMSKKTKYALFFTFFTLYVLLGMCLSYYIAYEKNLFFGADNSRAAGDLVVIEGIHSRISVHPLLLVLIQPVYWLIRGIVNHQLMALTVLESACGATAVVLFYALLGNLGIHKTWKIIFSCLYGFSFSSMIFSTIPETFIFAGFFLVAYWYYLSCIAEQKEPLSKKEVAVLCMFGVVCFGVTLTNYICYLIGLVYLVFKRVPEIRKKFLMLFQLNMINVLLVLVACIFQKIIWPESSFFWTSILMALFNKEPYEEVCYMNFTIYKEKNLAWFKEVFLHPLLSADVYQKPGQEGDYRPILFGGYSVWLVKTVLTLATIVFFVLVIRCLIRMIMKKEKKNGFILALGLALLFNTCLHYIYGSTEAFIYSPHYLFLYLALICVAVNTLKNEVVKRCVMGGTIVLLGVEIVNNLWRYHDTLKLAMAYAGFECSLKKTIGGALIADLFVAVILFFYSRNRRNETEVADVTGKTLRLMEYYIVLVGISGLFIALNY